MLTNVEPNTHPRELPNLISLLRDERFASNCKSADVNYEGCTRMMLCEAPFADECRSQRCTSRHAATAMMRRELELERGGDVMHFASLRSHTSSSNAKARANHANAPDHVDTADLRRRRCRRRSAPPALRRRRGADVVAARHRSRFSLRRLYYCFRRVTANA